VGLVGAGGIAGVHAAAWQTIGADTTVWSEAGAPELAARFGLARAGSFDELVAGVDVLDICTPTPSHVGYLLRGIEAGRHVVCEKPITRTVAEARLVHAAARAHGVAVYPGHVVRYFPEYAALADAVTAGRIGTPAVLRFTRAGQAPASDWFFDHAQSGGLVLDQMVHDLDQARWLAGEVVEVFAAQNPPVSAGAVPRSVVAHVVLTHRSGALSMVQGVWGPPGSEFTTSFDVSGSAGRLQYDSRLHRDLAVDLAVELVGPGTPSYLPTTAGTDPYTAQLRDFAAAFAGGPPPRVSLADGAIAVALAEAADESARTGRPVAVDESAVLDSAGLDPAGAAR
jgi:myo-inositol 2-dehydrogenase/D-chiro-inositol 1-dehydrogenase